MKAAIYYFTGTGNSLWVARGLAGSLGDTRLVPMSSTAPMPDEDVVGLVFPVHIWGLPRRAIDTIRRLSAHRDKYYFAVAVNAGQVANTLVQLARLMRQTGLILSCGFDIPLPSNYTPWGGPGPATEQQARFSKAAARFGSMAAAIRKRQTLPPEKGPWWQNILFTWMYHMSFPYIPKMDKDFWMDSRCNACGICVRICPAANIRMNNGRPSWLHQCEQCLACLQWCPEKAIQYGKKTSQYERYHHPDIKLTDLLPVHTREAG